MRYTIWPKEGDALRVLERDVAWTCVPCERMREMSDVLGLHPASEDVLDAEHRASHRRVEPFGLLVPALHQLANLTGAVCSQLLYELTDACDGINPELLEAICSRAAYDGAVTALSILAQDGMIDVPLLWSPA